MVSAGVYIYSTGVRSIEFDGTDGVDCPEQTRQLLSQRG